MIGKLFFALLILTAAKLGAEETRIKGGRMELVNQGDTVLFTGGVRLDRGTDRLESSRMKTNKTRDKVTAQGNVRLFRQVSSTETWRGFGESGFYDTKSGEGYLEGQGKQKAHVVHTEILSSTMTRVVDVYANRIDFYRQTKKAFASGAVQGQMIEPETNDRYDFWADKADFNGDEKLITLSSVSTQPIVMQTNGPAKKTITGDRIVYNVELKHMQSEGTARAVFQDEKKKKGK